MKRLVLILALLSVCFFAGAEAQDGLYVWFGGEFQGGVWHDTVYAPVDEWVDIPVYFSGSSTNVVVAGMCLPLGINKAYVDQFDIVSCQEFAPFSQWYIGNFTNFNDEFQPGWASLTYNGLACLWPPCNYFRADPDTAILGLKFRIHAKLDSSLVNQTICNALGAGYDPIQGLANASDSIGTEFNITQHFACVKFAEEPPEPVPTLSEWGMLIMGLLLLAIGTVAVIRRRRVALQGNMR